MNSSNDADGVPDLPAFTPFDTTVDDACTALRVARGACPVAHSHGEPAFYTPLNYRDIRQIARDWETYSSGPSIMRPVPNRPKAPPIEFDPPEHTEWRRLFQAAANLQTTRRIEPLVRADARELIDAFAGRGSCDLVTELAEPLPLRALCHVLGLDRDKIPEVRRMALAFNRSFGDSAKQRETFTAFADFGTGEVVRRRTEPRDDLLTELAGATLDGAPLTPDQIGAFMVSFLNAGHTSTLTGLGGLFVDVLGDDDLRKRLLDDPGLVEAAVEESLRLHPPFFGFFRQAAMDTEVSGVPIAEGESLYLSYAAANLDPEEFERPESFELKRRNRRIMTFGFGIHACPGAPVARMELRVALQELLARLPDIRLADPDGVRVAFAASRTAVTIENVAATFTPR